METITYDFMGIPVVILSFRETEYNDGNKAILITQEWPPENFEPDPNIEEMAVSVNIVEAAHVLEEGQFFLKDWSEAEPLAKALMDLELIEYSGVSIPTGYVMAPICRLSDKAKAMLK